MGSTPTDLFICIHLIHSSVIMRFKRSSLLHILRLLSPLLFLFFILILYFQYFAHSVVCVVRPHTLFLLSLYLFYHTVAIFPSRTHTHAHAQTISSLFLSILPFLFIPRSLTPTPFIPFQIPTSRFHDVSESDPNFSGKEVRPYENESISWQHKYF